MTSLSAKAKNNVTITGNLNAGTTIVLGEGFGTDQSAFRQIIPAFEKDYKLLLYDNVGGGHSELSAFDPDRYHSLQAFASDLIALLDECKESKVIFVGHSVSGMIGLLASIKRPELFQKLILLAASPRYLNDNDEQYIGGFDQQTLDDLYAMMKNNYHAWASGFADMVMSNPERPQLAERFGKTLGALRPDIALMIAKVIFQSDYRKELEKVNHPVLVVQCQEDVAVPRETSEYLHRQIKNSSYQLIGATGHLPDVSAPDEVSKAILSFI
jgi:sigma-B regulation protein RsbQ